MLIVQAVLSTLILVTLIFTVYYSLRYRREQDPKLRGIYSSRMNIAMGLMLVIIAVSQLFFFTDSVTLRIFGVVCFILGAFNFFVGIRNHSLFNR
ncbi:YtpI family protein [Paenibacillus silviterrae]|uniref:YtpI family protein n=1 Tax=Paenibacillus silviterrae TaxID=3242194 RepID=UPI002543AC7A|nr:YtpI family protein [Paenibacillus chinjuensis]